MGGDDGPYALRRRVLPGKLEGLRIHTVDRCGRGQELPGQGLERRHMDLRPVEEADRAGSVRAKFGHEA